MKEINLVVLLDSHDLASGYLTTGIRRTERRLNEEGIEVKVTPLFLMEDEIENYQDLPRDAVVLVHGDYTHGFQAVGKLRKIIETGDRPDLTYIVPVDEMDFSGFKDPADYIFLRSYLETPGRVSVVDGNIPDFVYDEDNRRNPFTPLYRYIKGESA